MLKLPQSQALVGMEPASTASGPEVTARTVDEVATTQTSFCLHCESTSSQAAEKNPPDDRTTKNNEMPNLRASYRNDALNNLMQTTCQQRSSALAHLWRLQPPADLRRVAHVMLLKTSLIESLTPTVKS